MTNPGWAFGRGVAVPPDYKVDDYVNILEEALKALPDHQRIHPFQNTLLGIGLLVSAAASASSRIELSIVAAQNDQVDRANYYATYCRERLLLTINIAAQVIVMMDGLLGKPENVDNE